MDQTTAVEPDHLLAALAWWKYSQDSATYLFGDRLGDPDADRLADAITRRPGLTRSDAYQLFHGHATKPRIDRAFLLLEQHGRAHATKEETEGRTAECWYPGPDRGAA